MKRRHFTTSLVLGAASAALALPVRQKQIYLVIDDAGLDQKEAQQFLDIPIPMTIAVLPHLKHTKDVCIAIGRDEKKEIILHQPMEAYDKDKNPGQGAIYNSATPENVRNILDQNLRSVRGAKGMNNHMGSRVTENPEVMSEVLRFCKKHGFFYLDSKTAYNSQVPRLAKQFGMHMEERHIFLDIKHDRKYIRKMWSSAVTHAKEHGYVVVIGHVWSVESAAAIRDSYQTLQNQGYTFHRISERYIKQK